MDFLDKKRNEIDQVDEKLIELLEKRFEIIKEVKDYKKEKGFAVENKKREEEVLQRYKNSDLSKSFVGDFLNILFKEIKDEE